MPQPNDLSRSLLPLEQDRTLIVVIELSQSSWLVAGLIPGLERRPLKKLRPDEQTLRRLVQRWRDEAAKGGSMVTRTAVAFEAGRDGFWLARWLQSRGVEAHIIHPTSCRNLTRTQAGKDGPARYGNAGTRISRLAARRTRALQHGRGSHDR